MDILFCHGLLCSLIYFSFYGTCCCRALADVFCLIRRELTTHDCTFTTSPSSPHINPNSLLYSTSWICMTIFSPLYLTCLGETWTFVIFIFFIILPRNRKRRWKLSGVRKKYRQGYKGEYSINLLKKSLKIHQYTRHAYTSTPPNALQPLAFTADLASEKHLYSSPWCSSGASDALWTQLLHPEAALTFRSKLFSINLSSTWQ